MGGPTPGPPIFCCEIAAMSNARKLRFTSSAALFGSLLLTGTTIAKANEYDVVVYGATPAGIAAAVQAARMEKSVVLVSPEQRIGGALTHGLGAGQFPEPKMVCGIAAEFVKSVQAHYGQPGNWKWQKADAFGKAAGEIRSFEPSVALAILEKMLADAKVSVLRGERLERVAGVEKDENSRIVAITMESGTRLSGSVFIDAGYEGDLMASAGVHYTVGREGKDAYGEPSNGVRPVNVGEHQFGLRPIDPHLKKGDSSSGLLPFLNPSGPGKEGSGDHRIEAYAYRMCMTRDEQNRLPWKKPKGYREEWYELLFRHYNAGGFNIPWRSEPIPNGKTDTGNNGPISVDFVGQSHAYPEAGYEERERIAKQHLLYQQGLMWTMAHHLKSPVALRKQISQWGLAKDEFAESDGWPQQLHIRAARRMVSDVVLTEQHCLGAKTTARPVGLGAGRIRVHHVQRFVDTKGRVRNEGDLTIGGFSPFPIPYGAIVPKTEQCSNLLVPVCLSASHVAYSALRVESVSMTLGQSAATAAALAIDGKTTVQKIDYGSLQKRLLAAGQVIAWKPFEIVDGTVDPKQLQGIVIDDDKILRSGFTVSSGDARPFVGKSYLHDENSGEKGGKAVLFIPFIPKAGLYEVRMSFTSGEDRASNVPLVVGHAGGGAKLKLDQRKKPPIDGLFISLGKFLLNPGRGKSYVEVRNDGADGLVIVDCVQFIPISN